MSSAEWENIQPYLCSERLENDNSYLNIGDCEGESSHPILEENEGEESHLWIPQVNDDIKPKVGMPYSSLEEGKSFYKKYAREGGFGVRNATTNHDRKTGEVVSKMFFCSKEGIFIPKDKVANDEGKAKRKRRVSRQGCGAKIRIKKESEGRWVIVKFVESHNHPLSSPNKRHLIPSNRKLTPVKKSLFRQLKQANIGTSKIVQLFGIQAGGIDKVGMTERDLRNHERDNRMGDKSFDAQQIIDRFESEKQMDPSFYYAYAVDEENKLTHLFWADGLARKSYGHFGDVVVFDTTYDTNRYAMIFAPFTGVNHHRQSIIFGCGFLKDEKIESFVWLFEKWLEAMFDKHPGAIITDQDPAMRAAIMKMLPNTYHRYCLWHIMKKGSEKLGALWYRHEFISNFKSCVYNSETPDEFESTWEKLNESFRLFENDWLSSLYSIRDRWIPAYSKDIFLAGMRTTQRSESMNSFFDSYVNKKNSLVEFYSHFELALKKQRHNELDVENKSKHTKAQLKTRFLMEKQMADIYTAEIFNAFQDKLVASMECGANYIGDEGPARVFEVRRNMTGRVRRVTYDACEHRASCECHEMENEGIPCKHILTVLRNTFCERLPPHFILSRWSKTVTMSPIFDKDGYELGRTIYTLSPTTATNDIDARWCKFRSMAYQSVEAEQIVKDHLDSMQEKLGRLTIVGGNETNEERNMNSCELESSIRPPNMSKTKGSGKRLKGGKEISMEQRSKGHRQCKGCLEWNTGHDKRNCPQIKEQQQSGSVIIYHPYIESQASVPEMNIRDDEWY